MRHRHPQSAARRGDLCKVVSRELKSKPAIARDCRVKVKEMLHYRRENTGQVSEIKNSTVGVSQVTSLE